ncbi:MAG: hypothetical protein ACR2GJ_07185 [Gemmatimonadaceae bacterium]
MRRTYILAVGAALLVSSGCSNLGSIGNVLGSVLGGQQRQQQQQQMDVEIQQVDANNGRLYVRTQDGQSGQVRVDNNTMVVYNNQRYPVTSLERGDVVRVQLRQTQNNELYAARIDVLRSAR